ncbi:hypothetical protein [Bacillus thuringiensis]|uniref:hypothetical protein n=1 Tax=Bacillus thuringiensis TaxID=1428 RepID=UPI0005E42804|nr:hypothetical protein [Bacillus thuringiensis]ARX65261.1 hypothetical protein BVH75_04160 [Bacillus thuringiensis]MDA2423149.1 hypothetical protein [Bacillus cereus]MEB9695049.1 hypothetical protein [Bacillus cereus]CKG26110.1 Uncharacterised protein [Streptococcus pneumoniae]
MTLLEHLIQNYETARLKRPTACIKYSFKFSKTDINLYFDCYDEQLPALTLILKYYGSYHIQGFNPTVNNIFDAKYLEDINPVTLRDILVGNKLTVLYGEIERVIWEEDYVRCNYEKDNSFSSVQKFRKIDGKFINPFFDHFRRGRMKDKRLKELHSHLNISREKLREIQGMNFTIVTTDDSKRRKLFVDEWKRITLK